MPIISQFFGISIYMFFDDHNPPHFHAKYNEFEAVISINELKLLYGNLQPRVLGLVMEWAMSHKEELQSNWDLMTQSQPFKKIDPLI